MSDNSSLKPIAQVISGKGILKNLLKEELEKVGCLVEIKNYQDSSTGGNTALTMNNKSINNITYLVWIMEGLGLLKKMPNEKNIVKESLIENVNKLKGKNVRCVFIFPYVERKDNFLKTSKLLSIIREAGFEKNILVVGDICGEDIGKESSEKINTSDIFRDYYPVYLKELLNEIIKSLFTLSKKGAKALICKRFDEEETRKLLEKKLGKFSERSILRKFKKRRIKSKIYLNQNKEGLIKELERFAGSITYSKFEKISLGEGIYIHKKRPSQDIDVKVGMPEKSVLRDRDLFTYPKKDRLIKFISGFSFIKREQKSMKGKPKYSFNLKSVLVISFIVVNIFILSPLILHRTAELLCLTSDFENTVNNKNMTLNTKLCTPILNLLQKELSLFSKTNVLGGKYQDLALEASILTKYNDFNREIILLRKQSDILLKSVFNKGLSKSDLINVQIDLKKLSEDGAFLLSEITNFTSLNDNHKFFNKQLINVIDGYRKKTYLTSELLLNSENIFGFLGTKKYALVFVDSSVVRPSGGAIKEIAIFSLIDGIIEKIDIYDSTAISEKMKGYIVTPVILSNYIGEDSWSIADANWSTNYQENYDDIRPFLENSIDTKIDGLITVNSEFIGNFGKFISGKFGYEVQNTNENDLFNHEIINNDGVLNNLIETLSLTGENDGEFVAFLNNQLKQKNLLIYVANMGVDEQINRLGWSGSNYLDDCGDGCYVDFIKISDYELSDSRLADVARMGLLSVSIEEGLIKRDYMLTLVNVSDEAYKSYLRISVPKESGFSPIKIIGKDGKYQEVLNIKGLKGRKEAGVYIEIDPGENERLIFSWEGGYIEELEDIDRYKLSFFKQPGVHGLDTLIKILHYREADVVINSNNFLTDGGSILYNSSLSNDEIIELTFK